MAGSTIEWIAEDAAKEAGADSSRMNHGKSRTAARVSARSSKGAQQRAERSRSSQPAHIDNSQSEGTNRATRGKILAGAVIAVSRQGVKKLAMGDICEAAGVSRGTLYRYFSTKDDVLEAMSEYVSLTFEEGVVEVARRATEPLAILRAVLEFHFLQARQSDRMLEVEPLYALQFLRSHFPRHIAAMKKALAPVFEYVESEAGAPVNQDLIAQILIRMELSTLLVPPDPLWDRTPELLSEMLQSFIDLTKGQKQPARSARRASV